MSKSKSKMTAISLTVLASIGVFSVTAGCSAQLNDSVVGAEQGGRPSAAQADKATQVHMSVVNNTHQVLTLTSATSSGKGNAWQDRPTTLQPGEQQMVSNYAAGDAEINLSYTGATDGTTFTLHGETPLAGGNQATGTSSSTSYTVNAQNASGYNPQFNYYVVPGHTFTYTGNTDTYTVPPGVTSMKVTAIGGSSPSAQGFAAPSSGAQISGTLATTPGEVLTVAVGGNGSNDYNNALGGWGMTTGDSSFRGGNGTPGNEIAGGGGGATVVEDSTGQIVVVAGGAGGSGAGGGGLTGYNGGEGGAGGTLTGGNGQPAVNAGGKPGANTTSQGQDTLSGGNGAGGAGGGGLNGGLAGTSGTAGGGGAGSSSDTGLTNATVAPAPHPGNNITPPQVTFGPAD